MKKIFSIIIVASMMILLVTGVSAAGLFPESIPVGRLSGITNSSEEETYIFEISNNGQFKYGETFYRFNVRYELPMAIVNPSQETLASANVIGIWCYEVLEEEIRVDPFSVCDFNDIEIAILFQKYNYSDIEDIAYGITRKEPIPNEFVAKYNLWKPEVEKVDVYDLLSVVKCYFFGPLNFVVQGEEKMSMENFMDILAYNKDMGTSEFFVSYDTKIPEETTTSTEETTTTTEETTTTTEETTTTTTEEETTTTTTTEETTTTTEEETTTTLEETTTTTEETTTTTPEEITTTTPEVTTVPEETSFTFTTTTVDPVLDQLVWEIDGRGLRPKDPFGSEIREAEYDALVRTAENMGIDNYYILWTEHVIKYSIVMPPYYLSWDGLATQICPVPDMHTVAEDSELLQKIILSYNIPNSVREKDYSDQQFLTDEIYVLIWTVDDEGRKDLNVVVTSGLYVNWTLSGWCLIPLDEDGNAIYELWEV